MTQIKNIVKSQKDFFATGETKNVDFRIAMLKKLREAIKRKENAILNAMQADLKKPLLEAYTGEVMIMLEEIRLMLKNIRSWSKPQKVKTPLNLFKASSHIHSQPYGVSLAIAPWNYPVQLLFTPLIGAIAAGNCVVVKPSEFAPHSAEVSSEIIESCFPEHYCTAVQGGVKETTALLNEHFDFIFFTGSPRVGRIVAEAAASHLTPTVLELGGKSPCIVDKSANIEIAARRIVWGKFYNGGQTCTAPDYLLVDKQIKKPLLAAMVACIKDFFGDDPKQSPDLARIISAKHFARLQNFLNTGDIITGGAYSKEDFYIAPTIIDNSSWDDPIMREEIFGPIMPVIEYQDIDNVIDAINQREKPLAIYLFSNDRKLQKKVLHETSSGGGCINATLMHVVNPHLPFGGVGNSGMGNYHGKASFDAFSHKRGILSKAIWPDLKLLYPPYKNKLNMIKKFF